MCWALLLELTYCFLGDTNPRSWILVEVLPALQQRVRQLNTDNYWLVRNGHWAIRGPVLPTSPHCSRRDENPMGFDNDHRRFLPLPYPIHSPSLRSQLLASSTVSFAILDLREDSDHGILDAGIYHFSSLHLGS